MLFSISLVDQSPPANVLPVGMVQGSKARFIVPMVHQPSDRGGAPSHALPVWLSQVQ